MLIKTSTETWSGGLIYFCDLSSEKFIHFTSLERAKLILNDNKLLMLPPFKKRGTDNVCAVSLSYGRYVPNVQHTANRDLVGILFSTSNKPNYGFVEEVVWKNDVNLINPEIILFEEAIQLLKNTKFKLSDSDEIRYLSDFSCDLENGFSI